ncbi:MAG TPA: hypothetical protein VGM74_01260 [Burkholderiaceae bacterium]|jgi:hypothetical protein
MRKTMWSLATPWIGLMSLGGLASSPALALDAGEATSSVQHSDWARWQGRLELGAGRANWQTGPDSAKIGSASLMGDYYFSRALFNGAGGFRATSGLIFGPRSAVLSTGQPGLGAGRAFSVGSRSLALSAAPYGSDPSLSDNATVPYLGFGYTGLSVRNGWSVSADLGLVAQTPGGLRAARNPNLDDAVGEMRLAPLLQFAVSYAF